MNTAHPLVDLPPSRDDQARDLPEDLRAWVDAPDLVHLVFEAAPALQEGREGPDLSLVPPGMARTVVTLLVYSYAIGLSSSDEIERQVDLDPELAYLSARTWPSSHTLRQVRRRSRPALQATLSKLLQLVAHLHGTSFTKAQGPEFFQAAAQERVDRAVLADTMALDA